MARNSGTSPEQRAQLLRELSQDLNRTRNSSASAKFSQGTASPEITSSTFDPENEALVSTRQLDTPPLPQMRATAEKCNKSAQAQNHTEPRSELDYAIDTSAIGRAFPDFSLGGTSSDDGSVSIEIGRGIRKGSNNTIGKLGKSKHSQSPAISNRDDSFNFSAPVAGNHYVAGTPPLLNPKTRSNVGSGHAKPATGNQVRSSGLRQEVRNTTPPLVKSKDYVSGSSRHGSENRQTLAAMHARVRDENDASQISEGRPPAVDLTARGSRFSSAKYQNRDQRKGLPARFSSRQDFLPSKSQKDADTVATKRVLPQGAPVSNPTTQSIVLPQMPNVSELLSGVFENGTPVFTRHGKTRASRFASGARVQKRQISRVDEIEVPQEEQDIYMALQIAEDKIADLERNRAEAEYALDDLQERNRILEAEKADQSRRQRSDSAIGLTDGGSDAGDEMSGAQRKILIEKNRLESSVRMLSSQVKALERNAAVSDIAAKKVTEERDSAISQLGIAYVTIEQLKSENANLAKENMELKANVVSTAGAPQRTYRHGGIDDNYSNRMQRGANNVEHTDALGGSQSRRNNASANDKSSKLPVEEQFAAAVSKKADNRDQAGDSSRFPRRRPSGKVSRQEEGHPTDLFLSGERMQRSNDSPEDKISEDSGSEQGEQAGAPENSERPERNNSTQKGTRDLTYLSILENDEIAELRIRLEHERQERKQRKALQNPDPRSKDDTGHPGTAEHTQQQKLPRKPSLKTTIRQGTDPKESTERLFTAPQADPTEKVPAEHSRRRSETSMDVRRQQRRQQEADNMTSAFILPDITIREPAPELSAAGAKVLDDLNNHNGQNCTVCHQTTNMETSHDRVDATKETIMVPKPIPVSDRMSEQNEYNEDPTIRPSQPPALALATVLKGLEDELTHLKIQLAHYQKLYSGHDPALSKRQRKSVCNRIKTLLKLIEVKADQIYSLYDVLEGQKKDGHEITEQEVEVTLQSVGIDTAGLGLRGGGIPEQERAECHPWDLESNSESEDELPWEGIESTTGTAKSGHMLESRRRSSAA